jgi:hypothetical protein
MAHNNPNPSQEWRKMILINNFEIPIIPPYMNILHILNGDATLKSFEDTGLDGDTMVWREVFSEGPLEGDISSGAFWRARMDWICQNEHESPEGYQEKVLNQLTLLTGQYDEINIWFEYDLHCQANMLGVMTYLKQQADLSAPAIYLICPSEYPGKENFKGMGELNGEELEYLYDNIRVQLNGMDFILAAEAWGVYTSRKAEKLNKYLTNTNFWGNLHCLKPALQAQLKRLQLNEIGLNTVEQRLLDSYNNGAKTRTEIYNAFWETDKIYGMGDMEIDIYLHHLQEKHFINL